MIRIGTRKSKLAMIQTEIVKSAIVQAFPNEVIEIVPIITQGDKSLDRSLASFGGKGVFTGELEEALLNGKIDMAVHSAKDMPMEFPKGLEIGAVLPRANAQDILVTTTGISAAELPPGSVIGTSSLRREIQIKSQNSLVQIKVLRGNVPTRMEKLRQGSYDGIILAAAGLERLGLESAEGFFFEPMDIEQFVPAAGQGIMAVEMRIGDRKEIARAIHSPETAVLLKAERKFLKLLGGSCNAPCGVYCRETAEGLTMTAMYACDGKHPVYRSLTVDLTEDAPSVLAERLAQMVSLKTVFLVGAGPGDKNLLSRKGLSCIQKADVIIYDNLIAPSILNEASENARLIYAGKRASHHHMPQETINQLLVKEALAGNAVVRLKGGDPYVFGRGGEEALELRVKKIPFEIVPGISSAYSVPAYAGIPVTQRGLASSFHVITGQERGGKEEDALDYQTLAGEEGTLIFLMGLHRLESITSRLIAFGKEKDTLAAVISHGATGRQRVVTGTLETIAKMVSESGITTPAVTVIGNVVSMEQSLSWFGHGALFGKRILLSGTRRMVAQMEKSLDVLGAETIALSLLRTKFCVTPEYLNALGQMETYQWLVFTSGNGVELFFDHLKEQKIDYRKLREVKFATVGSASAEALRNYGFFSDFCPSKYTVADLAKEWIPMLSGEEKILILRAKEGSDLLCRQLLEKGIATDDIKLYETCRDLRRKEELNRIITDIDYVVITSGSGAQALSDMLDEKDAVKKLISIGPVTSLEACKAGLVVYRTAMTYTAEGIAAVLLDDVRKERERSWQK